MSSCGLRFEASQTRNMQPKCLNYNLELQGIVRMVSRVSGSEVPGLQVQCSQTEAEASSIKYNATFEKTVNSAKAPILGIDSSQS